MLCSLTCQLSPFQRQDWNQKIEELTGGPGQIFLNLHRLVPLTLPCHVFFFSFAFPPEPPQKKVMIENFSEEMKAEFGHQSKVSMMNLGGVSVYHV